MPRFHRARSLACLALAASSVAAQEAPKHVVRVLDQAPLAPTAQSSLAKLNEAAERPFRAQRSPVHGSLRSISGGRLATKGSDRSAAALAFLDEHGRLFGLPAALAAQTTQRGERVYVSFTLRELPIVGLAATVLFDGRGNILGANVEARGDATPLGAFTISPQEAEAAALAAVTSERVRASHVRRSSQVAWQPARTERVWLAQRNGFVPAFRVGLASARPGDSWSALIDARDGRSLRVVDRVARGSGEYPFFGAFIPFSTGSAKGHVFRSVEDTLDGVFASKSMKNWSKGVPAPVDLAKGFLIGAIADIYDAGGNNVFAEDGDFRVDPNAFPDEFDQANTYFQLDTFYAHLKKNLKRDLNSRFALPVIVNLKDDTPNAFFSPAPFDDGHTDGFLVFFDLDNIFGPAGDFSRDVTVVSHEYTHAWIHFEGESFEDPLDYPTRAVGEAIPDFFALAWQEQTVLAEYIDAVMDLGIARDLQDDDHLSTTVDDAIALTATGLPEEHRSGEVFGSLLTDLRFLLKTKKAENLVFDALPFMADTTADIGYPVVDALNAYDASGDYFAHCVGGLIDAAADGGQIAAILGAATTRGVLGDEFSTQNFFVDLSTFKKGKIEIPSAFLPGILTQSFLFSSPESTTLTVKIKADKRSAVEPDFDLFAADGSPFPAVETQERKYGSDGRSVTAKKIELLLPADDIYQLVVFDFSGLGGSYEVTIDV